MWPEHLPVEKFRIARPTHQLEAVVSFYCEAIGLPEVGRFGFEHPGAGGGVLIGLPDMTYHLEIITATEGMTPQAPTRDNLLVFYISDQPTIRRIVARMAAHGHQPVPPENPYWSKGGVAFEDPDGWGVVFMDMDERRRLLNL